MVLKIRFCKLHFFSACISLLNSANRVHRKENARWQRICIITFFMEKPLKACISYEQQWNLHSGRTQAHNLLCSSSIFTMRTSHSSFLSMPLCSDPTKIDVFSLIAQSSYSIVQKKERPDLDLKSGLGAIWTGNIGSQVFRIWSRRGSPAQIQQLILWHGSLTLGRILLKEECWVP